MIPKFDSLGFFKEYYLNNKFIGSVPCENDRDEIGYYGKKTEVLTEPVTCQNGKKIKVGTEVMTVIYPLCGSNNLKL